MQKAIILYLQVVEKAQASTFYDLYRRTRTEWRRLLSADRMSRLTETHDDIQTKKPDGPEITAAKGHHVCPLSFGLLSPRWVQEWSLPPHFVPVSCRRGYRLSTDEVSGISKTTRRQLLDELRGTASKPRAAKLDHTRFAGSNKLQLASSSLTVACFKHPAAGVSRALHAPSTSAFLVPALAYASHKARMGRSLALLLVACCLTGAA